MAWRAGMDGWQIRRCAGVEAALTDAALAPHTLVAALEALPADTKPEPTKQEFIDAAAQGILLEALAPLVQQVRPDTAKAVRPMRLSNAQEPPSCCVQEAQALPAYTPVKAIKVGHGHAGHPAGKFALPVQQMRLVL